jgi:hypothetical protein
MKNIEQWMLKKAAEEVERNKEILRKIDEEKKNQGSSGANSSSALLAAKS